MTFDQIHIKSLKVGQQLINLGKVRFVDHFTNTVVVYIEGFERGIQYDPNSQIFIKPQDQ